MLQSSGILHAFRALFGRAIFAPPAEVGAYVTESKMKGNRFQRRGTGNPLKRKAISVKHSVGFAPLFGENPGKIKRLEHVVPSRGGWACEFICAFGQGDFGAQDVTT
jgi:hypothetical protein